LRRDTIGAIHLLRYLKLRKGEKDSTLSKVEIDELAEIRLKHSIAPKGTFELPTTWRSAKGVSGKFSDGKHSFRIDTHNLSPGERFHIHIKDVRGNEIAVIQGRGTNGIWRESHRGQTLLKPSEVSDALSNDIRRLLRHALKNIE